MSRYYCEFKNCKCNHFVSDLSKKNNICKNCNHANIWHSRKCNPPPCDSYLSFVTPRKSARKPQYVSDIHFAKIFIPQQLPLAIATEITHNNYCSHIDLLEV